MAAHKLTAPDGSTVTVASAERRDVLLSRGYTATRSTSSKGDDDAPAPAKRTTKRSTKAKG